MRLSNLVCLVCLVLFAASHVAAQTPAAKGVYRIPFPDGTDVSIGNDHKTHSPRNRIDMSASSAGTQVVAAAAGKVRVVVDNNDTFCPRTPSTSLGPFETDGEPGISNPELSAAFNASAANRTTILNAFMAVCSGYSGPSARCCVRSVATIGQTCQWMGAPAGTTCGSGTDGDGPNNYVWIEHPNGEWTKYTHLRTNSALVSVGQNVVPGTPLGVEGDVGFATGRHVHFEVAGIDSVDEIAGDGFLVDNDTIAGVNLRNRVPTFCQVGVVRKGPSIKAVKCDDSCGRADEVVGGVFGASSPTLLFQATNTLTTSAKVQASGGLAVRAGRKITLAPGFSAVGGGFFAAEIGPCDAPGGSGDGG